MQSSLFAAFLFGTDSFVVAQAVGAKDPNDAKSLKEL
jgi:hypothetical protein